MSKDGEGRLVADEKELPGLKLAFEKYATGSFSDNDIAQLLNSKGYRTKTDRPFSKETVRFMLQNRTYLGKIRYQETIYNSNGSRSRKAPIQWMEGKHEPVIEESVFDQCAAMRTRRRRHRQPTNKYNPYLLRNLVYCYRCCSHPPEGKTFNVYGKMRAHTRMGKPYYRCRAREMGYSCIQRAVKAELIDAQVLGVLDQLTPPADWRRGITKAMGELLGDRKLEERLAELNEIIRRMDLRWDNGFFVDEQEYFEKRLKYQSEIERLTPVANEDLEQAADLLHHFQRNLDKCGDDIEAQHDLVKLIVERVYVEDNNVVAMTLKSNYHLVLGHNVNEPTEYTIDPFMNPTLEKSAYTCGDDGI